ncbi:MAG: enoyl-CoA hydratase/isomerase family protein [Deltaproteobacteria bacterium]|nr:enoyl-CoA hydratase/isomerase family protein [Deltaproteobacteria bacterium]
MFYKTNPPFFRIFLNRPETLNALNYDILKSILEATESAKRSDARFVLIESFERRAFVAGADVKYFSSLENESLRQYLMFGKRVFDAISNLPQLTFAIVDGYCLGGGFELALAADFILSTSKSKFGFPESTLGLIPGFSGLARSVQKFGYQIAKRLILSGQILDFESAKKLNLIDFEISDATFETTSKLIIETFGKTSPSAVKTTKKIFTDIMRAEKCNFDYQESESFIDCFESDEGREGIKAFLEKRKSKFNIS